MTAEAIYKKYADNNGLVSIYDLQKEGWSKAKAENEGLIIKEGFKSAISKY